MNKKQWDHLAKELATIANLTLGSLALNQLLATTSFHPWVFTAGMLGAACVLHMSAIYCLVTKR